MRRYKTNIDNMPTLLFPVDDVKRINAKVYRRGLHAIKIVSVKINGKEIVPVNPAILIEDDTFPTCESNSDGFLYTIDFEKSALAQVCRWKAYKAA